MIKPILLTLGLAFLGANAFAASSAVNDQNAPVAAGLSSGSVIEASASIKEDSAMAERLS